MFFWNPESQIEGVAKGLHYIWAVVLSTFMLNDLSNSRSLLPVGASRSQQPRSSGWWVSGHQSWKWTQHLVGAKTWLHARTFFFFWFVCFCSCNDEIRRKKLMSTFSSTIIFEHLILQWPLCKAGTEGKNRFQHVPSRNFSVPWHKYLRENGLYWPSRMRRCSVPLLEWKRKCWSRFK